MDENMTLIIPKQTLEKSLRHNAVASYLASLNSAHSRRAAQQAFRRILIVAGVIDPEFDDHERQMDKVIAFEWHQLTYAEMQLIKLKLQEHEFSASTINLSLTALRKVLYHAWKLGLMDGEHYQRLKDVPDIKYSRQPSGRDMSQDEIYALLLVNDVSTHAGIRNLALIAVLAATGMRREEIALLHTSDYEPKTGKITIQRGKGNKQRTVYVKNNAKRLLDTWVSRRNAKIGGDGALFNRIRKGDKIINSGITSQGVYDILEKIRLKAGVKPFSPHDLRRTFVGNALDAGIDLLTVSNIVGHSDPNTTKKYDRRGERAKEEAAQKIDI